VPIRRLPGVIISAVAHPPNLANSTRTRSLSADGQRTEFVYLYGSREELGEEHFEWLIESFPIEAAK
jgi:hypothetical protein